MRVRLLNWHHILRNGDPNSSCGSIYYNNKLKDRELSDKLGSSQIRLKNSPFSLSCTVFQS